MFTFLIILTTCIVNVQIAFEQMLGKTKKDVQTMMNSHGEFAFNNFGVSTNDNTLRYYNSIKDVTLMFYFDDLQKCKHVKLMEDISTLDKRVLELNQKYKKNGNNWVSNTNSKAVKIDIDKDEYNYSLNYHF